MVLNSDLIRAYRLSRRDTVITPDHGSDSEEFVRRPMRVIHRNRRLPSSDLRSGRPPRVATNTRAGGREDCWPTQAGGRGIAQWLTHQRRKKKKQAKSSKRGFPPGKPLRPWQASRLALAGILGGLILEKGQHPGPLPQAYPPPLIVLGGTFGAVAGDDNPSRVVLRGRSGA